MIYNKAGKDGPVYLGMRGKPVFHTERDSMKTYQELRKTYKQFIYHGFEITEEPGKVCLTYDFEIPGLASFEPRWEIPCNRENLGEDDTFLNMVFSLGMVELISYWKIACPREVIVEPWGLTEKQIKWWKRLYFNGLGEFYYTNGIEENEEDFMEIKALGEVWLPETAEQQKLDSGMTEGGEKYSRDAKGNESGKKAGVCLVPVGGGKDSSVSLEILKEWKDSNCCYIINPRGATLDSAKAAGYEDDQVIAVQRTLDANMLRLNKEGYLNGHTPFSAIVAFSATITAYLNGLTYIVLSNESSANESTVKDSYVNHQYSKSFQFEKDFYEYEKEYLGSGTYYFSLLRPLSEFQIAAFFAGIPVYHDVFKSCNAGSKENIWCGKCSKCLFVWLILSPFLTQERLTEIFGVNMAENPEMEEYFKQLIGLSKEKPFECVGSCDEINAAIALTIRDYPEDKELPYLFKRYKELGCYEENLPVCENYFGYYDHENLLPEAFEEKFMAELKKRGVYRD